MRSTESLSVSCTSDFYVTRATPPIQIQTQKTFQTQIDRPWDSDRHLLHNHMSINSQTRVQEPIPVLDVVLVTTPSPLLPTLNKCPMSVVMLAVSLKVYIIPSLFMCGME